jgi:hypothetical protein
VSESSSAPTQAQSVLSSDGAGDSILQALATANAGNFPNLARHFIKRWSKALRAETITEEIDQSGAQFKTVLKGLYFRGFEEPHALLLPVFWTPTRSCLAERLRQFTAGDPPVLLCTSEKQSWELTALLPQGRAVVLSPQTIAAVFSNDLIRSRSALQQAIRQQVPLLRLQPYDTTRPVVGEMFVGREHEMNLLRNQERDSFLITGPSKIGKTSLLQHYRWTLRREGDLRAARSFYVNLQPCASLREDEVARYFAVSFRDVPYTSGNLILNELRSFLFSVVTSVGGPVEIILDEADAVCHMDLLVIVAEFASLSRSRVIVIGRGKVRQYQRRHYGTAFGRLREMRFHALDVENAWLLFQRPIESLGFQIESPDAVRETLLRQTSRMPHLIQSCARSVVEFVSESGADIITAAMVRRCHDSFLDFGVLRTHLDDLQSPRNQLAAIEVLEGVRQRIFTVDRIQQALRTYGIEITASEASDVCDDLVTNCLLTWDKFGYGPPRWDIYETARHHSNYLSALREESISKLASIAR